MILRVAPYTEQKYAYFVINKQGIVLLTLVKTVLFCGTYIRWRFPLLSPTSKNCPGGQTPTASTLVSAIRWMNGGCLLSRQRRWDLNHWSRKTYRRWGVAKRTESSGQRGPLWYRLPPRCSQNWCRQTTLVGARSMTAIIGQASVLHVLHDLVNSVFTSTFTEKKQRWLKTMQWIARTSVNELMGTY